MKGFFFIFYIWALLAFSSAPFSASSAQVFVPRDNKAGSKPSLYKKPRLKQKRQKPKTSQIRRKDAYDSSNRDGYQNQNKQRNKRSIFQNQSVAVDPAKQWVQPSPVAVSPYVDLLKQPCTKKERKSVQSFQNYYAQKLKNMDEHKTPKSLSRKSQAQYQKIDQFLSTDAGRERARKTAMKCHESLWSKK